MHKFWQQIGLGALTGLGVLLGSCGSEGQSNLDIVDGLQIPYTEEPAVVFLYNEGNNIRGGGVCTGTFIRPQVMITAAHCTDFVQSERGQGFNEETRDELTVLGWDPQLDDDDNPTNGISGNFFPLAKSARIFRHPAVTRRTIKSVTPNDLAIVYFDDYRSSATKNLGVTAPRRNTRTTIIGFGADSIQPSAGDDSVGKKRRGQVRVTRVGDFISFKGPKGTTCQRRCGENSNAAPGDSGGPMVLGNEVVGVTSGGSIFESVYVNLNSRSSRAFISAVENELGIALR